MIDPNSQTWLAIEAYINKQIEMARDSLEIRDADTDFLRGVIAAYRDLLKQGEPKPDIPNSPVY